MKRMFSFMTLLYLRSVLLSGEGYVALSASHVGFYQSHQEGVYKHEDAEDKDAIALLQVRSQANPERHTKDGSISKNRGQCYDALHTYIVVSFCLI